MRGLADTQHSGPDKVARRSGRRREPNRSVSVCGLSSGTQARSGLTAGKECRRPRLDRTASPSGLPSEQEVVAPKTLARGQILTSAFLCARQSASRATEHSDAALTRRYVWDRV